MTMRGPADWDAIVIGAGPNGLVAAAYLARARLKVLVLEAGEPDAAVPRHHVAGFRADIARDLGLARHGLGWSAQRVPWDVRHPDAPALLLAPDDTAGAAVTSGLAQADRDRRTALNRRIAAEAAMLGRALQGPRLDSARLALPDPVASLRLATMSLAHLLDETFEHKGLKAAIAAGALEGVAAPPEAPGTAYTLVLGAAMSGPRAGLAVPRGGPRMLLRALAAAAKAAGATLRHGARVTAIRLNEGAARSVVLADGEEIAAGHVLASLAPALVLRGLVGARHLDIGRAAALGAPAVAGRTALVRIESRGRIAGPDGGPPVRLLLPGVDSADDPLAALTLDAIPQAALSGEDVAGVEAASVLVQGLPADGLPLSEGREHLLHRVLRRLEAHWPDLVHHAGEVTLTLPQDVERLTGAPGGHWHHGEPTLARLLDADVETGIPGLTMCGAAARPWGGVTGEPGRAAARHVLAGLKTRRWPGRV